MKALSKLRGNLDTLHYPHFFIYSEVLGEFSLYRPVNVTVHDIYDVYEIYRHRWSNLHGKS